MLNNIIKKGVLRFLFCASSKALEAPKRFSETYTKARNVMPLYQLKPMQASSNNFVAPNATIVGEIYLGTNISIGHGTVVRGDINAVYIHREVYISENCVLHTAASLPSGLPASLTIETNSYIGPGCTLYSCTIHDSVFVGSNSVILEGAVLEKGCILLPNSVVPPGRLVPAGQVWGGNPIKFVRFAKDQQKFVTKFFTENSNKSLYEYNDQFLRLNNAYLYKPSDPEADKIRSYDIAGFEKSIENRPNESGNNAM